MRPHNLTRLVVAAACILVFAADRAAWASNVPAYGNATPSSDGNGVDLGAASGSTAPAKSAGSAGGTSDITCTSVPLASLKDPSMPNPGSLGGTTDFGQVIPPNTEGTWAYQQCFHADGTEAGRPGVTFFAPSKPADPVQLMQVAKNHLALPAPTVRLSPGTDHWQYVQMPTWAWVPASGWTPLTASASAGPVAVTVTATPVRLVFAYQVSGSGASANATCVGPGTPYSDQLAVAEDPRRPVLAASPDCGWTWHQSSVDTPDLKYAVAAHVVYHVVWTARGAPGGGDLGELNGRDSAFRVPVGEIQAVNIAPR